MIADLRSDYVNPVEFTQKTNILWTPEVVGVGFVTFVSLVWGTWWIFLLHVPLCAYLGYMCPRPILPCKFSSQLLKETTPRHPN